MDEAKLAVHRASLFRQIELGQFDPKALYVYENDGLWATAALGVSDDDWVGTIDNFRIIAPSWNAGKRASQESRSASQPLIGLKDYFVQHHLLQYQVGTQLDFKVDGNGLPFLGSGWSDPEPWGVWSGAESASITMLLENLPASDVALEINADGFIWPNYPLQRIEVRVNGEDMGEFTYSLNERSGIRSIRIPSSRLLGPAGFTHIQFRFPDANSPANIRVSIDRRTLAMGIRTLVIKPVRD
jgi:hypothetical protein